MISFINGTAGMFLIIGQPPPSREPRAPIPEPRDSCRIRASTRSTLNMRLSTQAVALFTAIFFMTALVAGERFQAGGGTQAAKPAEGSNSFRPDGDLTQVMRGILFPNSNLIFDVQQHDPAAPAAKPDVASASATQIYASTYTGWLAVENAAVALEESADIILKAGRLCSNGKLVPVDRPDYIRFSEALRESGRRALVAAKAKNQEQEIDVTNDITEACFNCHQVYRKGPIGSSARCTP